MNNNIYFRHMDIGIQWILKDKNYINKLIENVGDKLADHWKLSITDLTDEFLNWLDKHNLAVKYVELFYCSPKGSIFLHIDEIDPVNCCKINWVYDNGETWMRWARLKDGKQIYKQNNNIGGTYYTAMPGDFDYVEQTKIGKPTLVNAYHLHDVVNPTDQCRWCVSVVPKYKNNNSRLVWDEAIEIFSPYFS